MTGPARIAAVLADLFAADPLERLPNVRGGEREPLGRSLRYGVWLRDNGRCQWCGTRDDLQFDHIVPWSNGGSDRSDNLRLLCARCNDTRSNRRTDVWTRVLPIATECLRCARPQQRPTCGDEPAEYVEQRDPVSAYCVACRAAAVAERGATA